MAHNGQDPRHYVDISEEGNQRRSISLLLASRRCYGDRQGENCAELVSAEPRQVIQVIVNHCSQTSD